MKQKAEEKYSPTPSSHWMKVDWTLEYFQMTKLWIPERNLWDESLEPSKNIEFTLFLVFYLKEC